MSSKEIFDELVVHCTIELFQSRNIELRRGPEVDTPIEYAAIIGFTSDEVRGMIGLGMYPTTLQYLASKNPGVAANAEDWLGESVNQLVGRFKNKLMRYNVAVSLALPTVLRGVHLRFLSTGPADPWTYSFETEGGPICAWLDVRHNPDLVLAPTCDPEMQGTPEGELMLF
jgi:hypothetical protein